MSSVNRRLVFNTRERVLSTDQNDQQALIDANLDGTAVSATAGVAGRAQGFGAVGSSVLASAVVDGLQVSAWNPGVDLQINVSPGLAYKVGTPPTSLDSPLRRIELTADYQLDLAPLVQAQPRWVAIEIAPADTVELTALRDIWQPATGTFVPANVTKIRTPSPIVTANAGTAAALPSLPDGTPGTLPLAYVYLAGGAVSLAVTDFISCRPLYANLADPQVRGGGFHVDTTGGSTCTPAGQRGSWSNGARYSTQAVALDLTTNELWNTGENFAGLAGFNRPVYGYICTAPYPSGYDADVIRRTREFLNFTSKVPSCPVVGQPLILFTIGAPASSTSPFGGRSLTSQDTVWGTGGSVSSIECHYVGCVSYLESEGGLLAQEASPATGDVRVLEAGADPILEATVTAGAGATVSVDFFPGDVDLAVNTPPPGAGVAIPLNTTKHLVGLGLTGTSDNARGRLYDENNAGFLIPLWAYSYSAATTGGIRDMTWAYTTTSCRLEVQEVAGVGNVTGLAFLFGYQDPTIALR